MQEALAIIEKQSLKKKIADIHVGDTVRVHQRIREGKKERIQVFEGLVISYRKQKSLNAFVTVRKVASGVGVEKSWFVHSPNVVKVQIVKRSKVRQAVLGYMRARSGKSARMSDQDFDRTAVNEADDRTIEQITKEEQATIAKQEKELDGDGASDADASKLVEKSTEDLAKQENKQANEADPDNDGSSKNKPVDEKINTDGDDEAQLPAEEAQKGIDKANT